MKNAEYSAHMYAWLLLGWANGKQIPFLSGGAQEAEHAKIVVGQEDGREAEQTFIDLIGRLGI